MAVLSAACAVCLIFSCVDIYKSGAFSPEAISFAFSKIALPIYLFLIGVIAGIIVWIFSEESEVKVRSTIDPRITSRKLRARLSKIEGAKKITVRERRVRIISLCVAVTLCVTSAIYPLIHILNRDHFSNTDVNAEIIAATLTVIPFLLVCFISLAVYSKIENDSFKREIADLKALGGKFSTEAPAKYAENRRALILVRIAVAIVAITFIVLGVLNGGANDVLQKAIKICTECIGLG